MAVLQFPVDIQLRGGKELAIRPNPLNDVSCLQALFPWLWSEGICIPFRSQLIGFQNDRVGLLPILVETGNGLDFLLIPRLKVEHDFIRVEFDEREHFGHFRLKLVKRILERKRGDGGSLWTDRIFQRLEKKEF
jgi:hypothetical protein